MRPVSWKELVKVCEEDGCRFDRQKGDHYVMTKPGLARPIVIPRKKDLKEDIVLSIARTLKLTKKEIEARLSGGKAKKAAAPSIQIARPESALPPASEE